MLNKDNEITVGSQKKKQFKAMVNNYMYDSKNGIHWSPDDIRHMVGLLSYYRAIEEKYFDYLIDTYNKKYNANFKEMVKKDLLLG